MDFSPLNFVDTCQIDSSTSTLLTVQCYSSAVSFNQILIVSITMILVVWSAIRIFNPQVKD